MFIIELGWRGVPWSTSVQVSAAKLRRLSRKSRNLTTTLIITLTFWRNVVFNGCVMGDITGNLTGDVTGDTAGWEGH